MHARTILRVSTVFEGRGRAAPTRRRRSGFQASGLKATAVNLNTTKHHHKFTTTTVSTPASGGVEMLVSYSRFTPQPGYLVTQTHPNQGGYPSG